MRAMPTTERKRASKDTAHASLPELAQTHTEEAVETLVDIMRGVRLNRQCSMPLLGSYSALNIMFKLIDSEILFGNYKFEQVAD